MSNPKLILQSVLNLATGGSEIFKDVESYIWHLPNPLNTGNINLRKGTYLNTHESLAAQFTVEKASPWYPVDFWEVYLTATA